MTSTSAAPAALHQGAEGYGSKGYRAYVLFALFIVNMFNVVDRTLIGVLGEPIRATFGLSDTLIGLLSGPAFAVMYTMLGIPFAMLAERMNRGTIIASAMAVWSAMTAVCGMAATTFQFALGRIGVGIGEAGCSPPAHSLISDYFPPHKRTVALSVYSLGTPIGSLFAAVAAGYFATNADTDWRSAFLWLGLPGVFLAVIFKLTVKEPPRGYSDPGGMDAQSDVKPSPFEVFGVVARKPAFVNLAAAGAITAFASYGVGQFLTPFWLRVHDLPFLTASFLFGLLIGVFGAVGTFVAGWLADKIRAKHPNSSAWIPAIGLACASPVYIIAFNTIAFSSGAAAVLIAVPIFAIAVVLHFSYMSPLFAITQNLVQPRMRATAAAVILFATNFIGYVGGPPIIGWMSDRAAVWTLDKTQAPVSLGDCNKIEQSLRNARKTKDTVPLPAEKVAELDATFKAHCTQARSNGIRFAMTVGALFYLWAAFHFLMVSRNLQRDSWKGHQPKPEDADEAPAAG